MHSKVALDLGLESWEIFGFLTPHSVTRGKSTRLKSLSRAAQSVSPALDTHYSHTVLVLAYLPFHLGRQLEVVPCMFLHIHSITTKLYNPTLSGPHSTS